MSSRKQAQARRKRYQKQQPNVVAKMNAATGETEYVPNRAKRRQMLGLAKKRPDPGKRKSGLMAMLQAQAKARANDPAQ